MKLSFFNISVFYLALFFTASPYFSFLAHEVAHIAYADHHSTADHPDVQLQDIDSVILQKQIVLGEDRSFSKYVVDFEFVSSLSNKAVFSKNIRGRDSPKSDICSHYYTHPSQAPPAQV